MLSADLHRQLFGNLNDAAPGRSTSLSGGPDARNKEATKLAELHLSRHELLGKNTRPLPEVEFTLPALAGPWKPSTIEDHFHTIACEQAEPFFSEASYFARCKLPPMPTAWTRAPGWTRYNRDGSVASVAHPPHNEPLVFDVEVMYKITQFPAMAIAATHDAWYSWCSPALFQDNPVFEHLIPLGRGTEPRIIIGHNVAYDRARILEEYSPEPTRNAFIDTMSLHCAVSGMSSQQRGKWTQYMRAKSASQRAVQESMQSLSDANGAPAADDIEDLSAVPLPQSLDHVAGSGHLDTPERDALADNPWLQVTSINSLKETAKLHLKKDIDKSVRDHFASEDPNMLADPEMFQMLMGYCANDVLVTHELFANLMPRFFQKCKHPASFAGMLHMGKGYLSISGKWQDFVDRCEAICTQYQTDIENALSALAYEALDIQADKSYESDPWLRNLDWNIKPPRMTSAKLGKDGSVIKPSVYAKTENMDLVGKPNWFREIWDKKNRKLALTTSKRIAPYLLRLRWQGYPVMHTSAYGWVFVRPKEECFGSEQLKNQMLEFSSDPNDRYFDPIASADHSKCYFRIPHPDGESSNCGNPLSKLYLSAFDSGKMSSSLPLAREIVEKHTQCSYWISTRGRITEQFVVPMSLVRKQVDSLYGKQVDSLYGKPAQQSGSPAGTATKPAQPSVEEDDQDGMGVIIPRSIVMGTITRRAVESMWMTASNAKSKRIGSEVKSMIVPPKGYSFVGADVDSEELWIASVIGDAQFGMHGSTAIGFMTLEGSKAAGTDLHSVTGRILGISRDQSKVFNYGRIYGAGVKYAVQLLLQSNPDMSREDAEAKAEDLYAKTKGLRWMRQRMDSPFRRLWYGGTESVMFNSLERIARSADPRTPVLGCQIPDALMPNNVFNGYMTSRINWVVQSSGVDYLHLLLVAMDYLIRRMRIDARFLISIHDELRYIVRNEHVELASLALQISNLWVRCMFASRLGIKDLPLNVAFFSLVDIDHCLRKEVDMSCVTPSNKTPIPPGRSLTIQQTLDALGGPAATRRLYGQELDSVKVVEKELRKRNFKSNLLNVDLVDIDVLEAQLAESKKDFDQIEQRRNNLVFETSKPVQIKASSGMAKAKTTDAQGAEESSQPSGEVSLAHVPSTRVTFKHTRSVKPASVTTDKPKSAEPKPRKPKKTEAADAQPDEPQPVEPKPPKARRAAATNAQLDNSQPVEPKPRRSKRAEAATISQTDEATPAEQQPAEQQPAEAGVPPAVPKPKARLGDMDACAWVQKLSAVHLAAAAPATADDAAVAVAATAAAANPEAAFAGLAASREVARFLGDVNTTMLTISINTKTSAVRCSFDVETPDANTRAIILSKTRPAVVTPENMAELVQVTQVRSTPVNTLYQAIHSVYAPVLLKSGRWGMSSRLQDTQIGSVATLDDEYAHWSRIAVDQKLASAERERGAYFAGALQPLKAELDKPASSLNTLVEAVEKSHGALDDIWRQNEHAVYPKARMEHLLDVITEHIIGQIQDKLRVQQVLTDLSPQIKDELVAASDALDRWIDILHTLTSTFWPLYSPNRWEGEPFSSPVLTSLRERLKKILLLRSSHESLLGLLPAEDQKELRADEALQAFSGFNPVECNASTDAAWAAALAQYNRMIQPLEERCAQKLQSLFGALQSQPAQLLREFQRYRDLVQREIIGRQLAAERETLLGQLAASLKTIRSDFRERSHHTAELKGRNLPAVIANIVWARQSIAKIQETDQTVTSLVGAKSAYQVLSAELYDDLRKYEREQFEDWAENTMRVLEETNGTLSASLSGRLMELDFASGKLVVNYGDHLVTLLREIRQLIAMGFPVSAKIQQAAENAQKLYRHGVVLKQVAHFYNTIDQQMLPSQQSMLLQAALSFERLIKEPRAAATASGPSGSFSWDNPQDLEAYIFQLQAAAEHLTAENRKLRKYHSVIEDHVVGLMSIDLVKNQARWKEVLNQIRGIITAAQEGGIKPELTLTWRNHWDYQLYKALEHQYQVGLESLNESLPEIKVDLVFKQQKLQFRPPYEEIRAKYYRELKKFINLPSAFKGVGETRVFGQLIDQNAASLSTVYNKAEALFQNLLKAHDVFKDWVVLGTVDLDAFVQDALGDVSDWEINFRMLKQKGKDVEQLPSVIKIDCISVSTAPVKATIDDHLQRLFDALLTALRKAVATHLAEIDEFVGKGMDILLKRPQTMAEIGEANTRHEELSKSKLSIQSNFEAAEAKNKLLKSVAGSGVDASAAQAKWSKLELMLESHELMIKEQVDMLRGAIDGRTQLFLGDLEKFTLRWQQLKPKAAEISKLDAALKAVAFIKERVAEFSELEKAAAQIVVDSSHFGVAPPDFAELEIVRDDLRRSEEMWSICEQYVEGINALRREDWITFRAKSYQFEEFLTQWNDKIRSREVDAISSQMLKDLDSYRSIAANLKFLRGDNWMSEHWGELFRILAMPRGVGVSDLTFGHFLDLREAVHAKLDEIKDLNSRANGEVAIREAIQELDIWGASAVFSLTEYQDARGGKLQLIKDWKETLTQIGDNQSLLSSLKDSPYFKNFAEKAHSWEQKLAELDEYLRQLNTVQRRWVYLEPIFSRGALPSEQGRFSRIDEDFRSIIGSVSADPRIVSVVGFPSIRSILLALVDQLERCQKALNEFLEQKRAKFARFYFIGDEDLLEILGQAKNPQVIQTHLKKLFAGVHNVQFDENMTSIVAMRSLHGEHVPLKSPVQVTDEVESWLQNFALEMKATLKAMLLECLAVSDIFKFPSQLIGLAEYLHFTSNAELIIQNGQSFAPLEKQLRDDLEKYTTFDTATIADKTERAVVELKIKSLILDIIHFLDVVDQLKRVERPLLTDWSWRRQLRFYLNEDKSCVIRMNDAEFEYTYEYQGNPPKLVHTPLTDKCYLTLTQAMSSGFGGNPFGPAGTGKTESVKALGVLFGRQVLVFNCDEGIDYKSMGRIFVGLVKCGAWGCFDEFNRLEEAVLSAVSQQIQVIQAALKRKERNVALLGKTVDLDPNSGIFVTLNPAGKGYGGRQKLPDNLKQLFRSVAMTHPNNELIAEVILFSEGFHLGRELGRKVVSIFTLCKQFLTPQQHYDWGLRPLKAVLGLAGSLLHEQKRRGPVNDAEEASVVVKALRVSTLSKLTFGDAQRFNMLMNDLFPGVGIKEISYEELQGAVRDAYQELNLIYIDSQAEKIFQLYEACRQRMGVVLVGPSGSGKSTIWRLLMHAWQKTGQRLVLHKTNPKAVDRQTLLGHMDMDTREWTDGILTFASRQAVKESLDVHTWVISDGDIDPEWIESLNSVLDDNRLLTMPNGERIQFGPNINFVFETHNLKFASPATVSRMGMIYLSDETLDVKVLVKGWLSKQPEKLQAALGGWIDTYFYKAIDWITSNSELVVETTKAGTVMNGLSQIGGASDRTQFLFGLIRGLGANMLIENRLAFANELLRWAGEQMSDPKRTLDYRVTSNGQLEMYQLDEPPSLDVAAMQDLDRLPVIETPDLKRSVDMIMPWLHDGHPFLLVGPEGAGKQTLLRHCFSKLKSTNVAVIHCSAQTKSSHVLQRLLQTCVASTSVKGRVLRPKDAEKLILYLKDINLPKPDKYETVELVQFLQQLLTYHGFFDAGLEWVSIENIQIVASMNPSTTIGRHKLSTRFTSTIRLSYIAYTDREQLQSIYRIMLRPIIETCLPSHRVWSLPKNVSKLAATIVSVYEQTVAKFTVDMYSHYLFTPRDISRLVLSLGRFVFSGADDNEVIDIVAYESQRLFQDRLVGADARQKFQALLFSVLRTEWSYQGSLSGVIFATADAGVGTSMPDLRLARALVRMPLEKYRDKIARQLQVYERDSRDLHLTLFPETLEIVARIERVLGQAGGSLLLAGRPGIPFTNVVHLVAAGLGYKLVSPKISRSYSTKAFAADLKQVLQSAGVAGEDAVFLVEDFQLIDPSFLESINSLLSGSEVSGVYPQDELETLLASLKDSHSEAGFRGSLYEYFVSRVRRHLHVVLVLDSASPQFASNCESNPALYTRCQLQWMDAWSLDSMAQLARDAFARSQSLQALEDKEALIKELLAVHQTCVARGAAPKHFAEYLAMYAQVYQTKRDMLQSKQSYLGGGLKKLNEAAAYVDRLSSDAKRQQAELTEKQRQADAALKQITESMVQASEQKKEMEALTASLKEEEAKMLVRKQAVEKELAEVEPVIRSAKAAVGEIRAESLSEIRSLRAPPPAIRDVLEAVLRLMGVLDMSWNSMKGFLGQRTIKDEIMNFDAHSINRQTREAVAELIRQKRDSFEEAVIKRVSVAAAPLAMWVKANLQYATVVEKVAPLEQDLQRLTATLDASRNRVQKLKEQLDVVDRKVQALKDDFGGKTREAESLKASLDKAMSVIHRAQGLLEKLSGEGSRWSSQVDSINKSIKALPRNGLLAAAFIVYLAGAPENVRQSMTVQWGQISNIRDFSFTRVMSTESEQLVWKSQGLPSDALSIENAIIAINSRTTSLVIDPSGQATEWIKHYLGDKKPEIVNQSDDSFMRSLELAVRFGKTLIVQEVSSIEAVLMPLLRRDLHKQGPRFIVELGEKAVDYSEDFRLYLVTRRSSFTLPPDAVGLVNDVNFTITRAGLAGQLLGVTLKHERPELEVQKMTLLKNEDELKLQLSNLEDQLLKELANSEGNILENMSLINSLNETKEKSNIIAKSLSESQKLQASLDAERDKFSPISTFGSALFFVVTDMQKISNMYRFSLSSFLRLFEEALRTETTSAQDGTELRIKLLMLRLERLTFSYISRSILKADRQMFALHMIHELHPTLFEAQEWELFTGQLVLADVDDKAADTPDWVPEERRAHFKQLQSVFPTLFQSLGFNSKDVWSEWIRSPNCESTFPRDKISPFQRLLVVQALRPDRLLTAMSAFSCNALGIDSLAPPPLNMKKILDEETIATEPILFITTPGADPSQDLKDFAVQTVGADKFNQVSMGQGQGDLALELLREAAETGGWLCLQNIHLVISWVPTLEKELLSLKLHPSFRLWLTSEMHAKFPASLLENCVKITIEAPPGVKKNLQRIYENWTPEFLQQGPPLRAQALFALAWFHAVIQERRNYIPQGWNKFYEFSAADLRSSAELISSMCMGTQAPQWAILHGLLEDAIYGGRIDDRQDALKLHTYLSHFFCDDVFTIDGKGPSRRICKTFALPRTNEHAAYRQIITELPESDNVVLFGLPANIDRTLQKLTSQSVIGQLKVLRQVDVQHQRFDRDKWSQELLPFLQLWKKLNTGVDLLQKKVVPQADADPVVAFFDLELLNALNLIRRIHTDLSSISKLIRGTILLSNDIQMIGTSLMRGETPAAWMNMWEGPELAQGYLRDVISKGVLVSALRDKASSSGLFKDPLALSGLFNPVTFLNALRQQTSRKLKQPMDSLRLVSTWNAMELKDCPLRVSVQGMLLQGCNFNGERLSESSSNDPIFVAVPVCHMGWVPEASIKLLGKLEVPLYVNPSRERIVATLMVPGVDDSAPWILAGVAFFLSPEN